MWNSISNLKENLSKIALDVYDDDQLEIYNSRDPDGSLSDRRISHRFAHSNSPSFSPVANGFDSSSNSEIEQYKTEIKRLQESEALSVNYAALLKEKEFMLFRCNYQGIRSKVQVLYSLNEENGLLKQNPDATNATLNASRNESFKTSINSQNVLKGSGDQSPNWQYKAIVKNHSTGNHTHNGVVSKQDVVSNGVAHSMQQLIFQSNVESRHPIVQGNEKELADLLEEKNRSLAAIRGTHELQLKVLEIELEKERGKLADIQVNLQEEQKLNGFFQQELNRIKAEKDETFMEMNKIRSELIEKNSEIRRMQNELKRKENSEADNIVEDLKRVIATLEKENSILKMEKTELEATLKVASNNSGHKISPDALETSNKHSTILNEVQSLENFPGKEEMELSLLNLEKDLKETRLQRDKTLQELNRLKQHLLDKESEESEKMDEDCQIIEELRESNENLRAQILHLQKTLREAIASQEEVKTIKEDELQKSREIISDLNKKLASCFNTIDAKNVELLNLETALGQYYAEIEAKERLEGDLALAREGSAKLSGLLKDANQQAEILKREKEEVLAKHSQAERLLVEGKNRLNKLEEDNVKLRRALEQSMTRLNRMSTDSDYFVDRRIVIKLLVTYFQRNHSKEVLDLMVRMLGFSDEEKQRIGVAQQGNGRGVVRGVLGLPGRLVGGILGGNSAEASANMASEKQSFADLWVDFLLKETEERERRESAEAPSSLYESSPNARKTDPPLADQFGHSDSDSDFSTVPLNLPGSNSRVKKSP
ncbi:golgin candidate 4-like isoform X2 [Cornus florida]|uniref:golgin candidate 4-like isoform X2 n=1 Tax=Cornus florida TaxID=4283 RepID=UPI0028A0A8A7|nr:golgin candidate 4-like isoform X2 [Cornus florida]